ncbi:hypothetical protein PCANC_06376 [Puccinia coronata f. sp. avenae]|uniref:F-box domain-containing protein n=1 Tax=Puccinia coronata f. sp. avenae TaxID=200324 RepID=A0A2N5VVR7_9BASI|nr:hypothetical protein PCASD_14302 [Puccinia coronata f. sp. avenae]PLW54079.1 hypothetical protein PCANC_06376 [Puccinia coronata f. sp. avenae]
MSAKPDLKSPVTRVFQRGITAFKAEDYPRAIQCFDQAFQASSNDSMPLRINILDSRAAAKEKNNDLKGSLSDSKKVIDMAPESPKGYIRAARLFNKIDRFPASIKMFELAIAKLTSSGKKNLPLIETLRAELQQVRMRARVWRAPPSSSSKPKTNFSGKMPFEIFIGIVSFLDTATRFRCMAVCSSWRQIILNTPRLWNHLSLDSYHHHKLMVKAKYWLQRLESDQQLHTLSITVSPIWPPSIIRNLLVFLADMLSKKSAPNACLRSFRFHQAGTAYGMAQEQKNFGDVIAFAYFNRNNLIELDICVPAFVTSPGTLPSFLATFPSLKALKLQGKQEPSLCMKMSPDFPRQPILYSNPGDDAGFDSEGSSTLMNRQINPVCLSATQPAKSLSNQELETLHIQHVSFTPSQGEPLKLPCLRSISLISTTISTLVLESDQASQVTRSLPGIDFTHSPTLENLHLGRGTFIQQQWAHAWHSVQRLPTLKRVRLEGLPLFISHFLGLANIPPDWSPRDHIDQPFEVEMEAIIPQLELLSLSSIDTLISYKFLAVFSYQFIKLDSLSLAGLILDSTTEPMLINALRHLPPLVNLNLSRTYAKDEVIEAIKSDRLRHLQLVECTRVTFRSLQRLATPNLEFLDITGCQSISTREMIEWLARRVGTLAWQESRDAPVRSARRLFLD